MRKDVELVKYGFTEGCQGCAAARAGKPPRVHSTACRERILKRMKEDKDARLTGDKETAENMRRGVSLQESGASSSSSGAMVVSLGTVASRPASEMQGDEEEPEAKRKCDSAQTMALAQRRNRKPHASATPRRHCP